jgi:hypothetical protein
MNIVYRARHYHFAIGYGACGNAVCMIASRQIPAFLAPVRFGEAPPWMASKNRDHE